MTISRRSFLTGLVAAPAVLRLGVWMPVKAWSEPTFLPIGVGGISVAEAERWLRDSMQYELRKIMAAGNPTPCSDAGVRLLESAANQAWNLLSPQEQNALQRRTDAFIRSGGYDRASFPSSHQSRSGPSGLSIGNASKILSTVDTVALAPNSGEASSSSSGDGLGFATAGASGKVGSGRPLVRSTVMAPQEARISPKTRHP